MLLQLQTRHCNGILILKTITVIVPYESPKNDLAKELLRTITVTVPLVDPDYRPMLLSHEKLKNLKFLKQKLRYSPETELINNFDKSHDSVLIAKIQHFVSITNTNNNVMAL
jgi:hypothetical protein